MSERVAIVGSRHGAHLEAVEHYVAMLAYGTVVVSGGAAGVDSTAARRARQAGLTVVEHLPKYELFGHSAPLVRNREIAEDCSRLVAFWNGTSTGTCHVIRETRKLGKPVLLIGPDGGGWDPNAVDYHSESNHALRIRTESE